MRFPVTNFIYLYCIILYAITANAQSSKTSQEKIATSNNELNEVVIKKQASLVKYAANGTLDVNVANTLLSTSSSVNELLGRVPNVIVAEGQISVLGKGEAIIYLNGILINYERFADSRFLTFRFRYFFW